MIMQQCFCLIKTNKKINNIEINKRGCENNNIVGRTIWIGPFVRYKTVAGNSVEVMMIELNWPVGR